jgi:hypothetical protein
VDDADVALADLAAGYEDLHAEILGRGRGRELASRGHQVRRRRVRRVLLVGGAITAAAALAVAPTGAAAAGWVSTHTGFFGTPGATESGTGEELDLGAHDFPGVARQLASSISYPPGDSADTYIARLQAAARDDQAQGRGRSLMEDAGVRKTLRLDATCAWSGYWLDAHDAGDTAKKAMAVRGLAHLPADLAYLRSGARAGDASKVRSFWVANCASLPRPWKGK